MREFHFNIISWAAWAPGLESKDDWKSWAGEKKSFSSDLSSTPNIDFIAAMHRRRLSQLTKMSLRTAFECSKEYGNVENVFASRYGELDQTIKLLKSISDNEELSPAGFSMSVHNTAAGINSVTSKNTKAYTTVSANETTFDAAFLESLGRLQNQEYILLVIGEEYVANYHPVTPFSVAFLLGKGGGEKIKAHIGKIKNSSNDSTALDFLKWLLLDSQKNFSAKLISFEKAKND